MQLKRFLSLSVLALFASIAHGQDAADILEKSIRIKKNERIFLKLERKDTSFFYLIANRPSQKNRDGELPIWRPVRQELIFASSNDYLEIYMKPYNPLNFSHESQLSMYTDPIDSVSNESLKVILDLLRQNLVADNGFDIKTNDFKDKYAEAFNGFNNLLVNIYAELQKDKKAEIIKSFKAMKASTFDSEQTTKEEIQGFKKSYDEIKARYDKLDTLMKQMKSNFDELIKVCADTTLLTDVLLRRTIVNDLQTDYQNKKNQFLKYEEAYKAIQAMYKLGTSNDEDSELNWLFRVKESVLEAGKMVNFQFTMSSGLAELKDDKNITATAKKKFKTIGFKVRSFNWIIPEPSIGTALLFMKYNEFSVSADSTGQHVVSDPVERTLTSLNVTAMLNLTLYIPESGVNPFWQIGGAYSSGLPSVFSGFGLRFNNNRMNRLALSFGGALTWTKELNTLRSGDFIENQSALDEDLKYMLAWPPRPYIGVQINF